MKLYAFHILLLLTAIVHAQKKTYLGPNSMELKNASGALYYRITEIEGDTVVEKTYFITDILCDIRHYDKNDFKIRIGEERVYYPDGKIKYIRHYQHNKLNGEVRGFYSSGSLRRLDHYRNDTLLDGKCFTTDGRDTAYIVFQKSAIYQGGGLDNFNKFVISRVKYPQLAVENGVSGKVIVAFIVNSKGEVVNVRALKSSDEMLSRAAEDAVKKSERWEPAEMEGEKCSQEFALPVIFSLTE